MSRNYDALVVGAGYIGCAVAYHLAAAGLRTAILERSAPGGGASGANYGSVQVQDAELAHSLPMTIAGYLCFPGLEAELDANVGFRRRGSLLVIENAAQWQLMADRLPALRRAGIRAELVPAERLGEIEPLLNPRAALGACYYPDEGQVHPFKLMQAYLRRGREHGLEVHSGTEVIGFGIVRGRLSSLHTPRGDFYAPVAVLATGAWTPGLGRTLRRSWHISHVHGQALVTETSGLKLRNHLSSAAFFEAMHESGEDGPAKAVLAVGQSLDGHFLLGEAGEITKDMSKAATREGQAAIASEIGRFLPALSRLRVLRGWAAPVAFTADGLPYLGPVAGVSGLILATAFKSTVIVTPLVGRSVAQFILTGRSGLDWAAFAPEREIVHA
jgi:sarcosine oxidase, subunit beta